MKWTFRIGTVRGIAIYVHGTFFLLLAWIAVADGLAKHSVAAAADAVWFTLALFACVVVHELGHAFMALRFGIRTRDIILLPIGGMGRLERLPDVPSQELWISLAGPAVSIGIAALLFAVLGVAGGGSQLLNTDVTGMPPFERLAIVNLGLAAFNLLPAFPLDGGRVLRALLAMRMDYVRATGIAATIGQTLALLLGLLGARTNPLLMLIALFIWLAGAEEANVVRLKAALAGVPVGRAMRTDCWTIAPDDALRHAADLSTRHGQRDFPVVSDDRIVGLLTRADLLRGLAEQGDEQRVAEVMHHEVGRIRPSTPLDDVFTQLQQGDGGALAVVEDGRLVGLIDMDGITDFLRLHAALRPQSRKMLRRGRAA